MTVSEHLNALVSRLPRLDGLAVPLNAACDAIVQAWQKDGTLFVCGNGGSAADSEHIAGELLKGFRKKRPLSAERQSAIRRICDRHGDAEFLIGELQQGCRVISLTGHPSLTSAVANDMAPGLNFAQQLNALGRKQDVLLGISTSGNARNVILAGLIARSLGMTVIALTGLDGGKLRQLADIVLAVPENETAVVQELHVAVYHTMCAILEDLQFSE